MALQFMKPAARVVTLTFISATLGLAAPFSTLTFNELKIAEGALNFYNGGLGSSGTGPGPSLGVTFTPDFATVTGGVIFPTPFSLQSEQLTSSSGTMNVLGGFSGQFSFYYIASQNSSAELFSGLNGAGSVVGVIPLPVMSSTPWFPAGGNFGAFESVVFTGSGLTVDNVTFGGLVLPEPFTVTLLPAGFTFLFAVAKLRRRIKSVQL
jgi:hypothetical protein